MTAASSREVQELIAEAEAALEAAGCRVSNPSDRCRQVLTYLDVVYERLAESTEAADRGDWVKSERVIQTARNQARRVLLEVRELQADAPGDQG